MGLLLVVGAAWYALTPREKLLAYVTPDISNSRITDMYIREPNATMRVQFDLTSPLIPVFIDSLTYDFRLYGQSVAHGNQKFKAVGKTGKLQPITLPISLNYTQTYPLIQRQAQEGTPVEAQLRAFGDLPLVGPQSFPLNKNLPIRFPALPAPELTAVETADFGFRHRRLVMTLAIDNPNNFDFYLRDLKMNIQLSDYLASAGSIPKDYLIKAHQVTTIKVPSTSAMEQSELTSQNLSGDSEWSYTMKTSLILEPVSDVVGKIRLDAVKTGTINMSKTK